MFRISLIFFFLLMPTASAVEWGPPTYHAEEGWIEGDGNDWNNARYASQIISVLTVFIQEPRSITDWGSFFMC
mgnify:CR=1 FL=1